MIRKAEKADIHSVEELSKDSNSLHEDWLQMLIAQYPAFVFEEEGEVVAFWVGEELDPELLLIRDFAVSREERYHKLGRKLMKSLQQEAQEAGYRALLLVLDGSAGEDFLLRTGWGVIYETGSSRIFSYSLL